MKTYQQKINNLCILLHLLLISDIASIKIMISNVLYGTELPIDGSKMGDIFLTNIVGD